MQLLQEDKIAQEGCLWKLISETIVFLWKDWPKNMEVTLLDDQATRFSLRGMCPHCTVPSVFMMVGGPHCKSLDNRFGHDLQLTVSAMQCQGCLQYILGLVVYNATMRRIDEVYCYPLGKPNDRVSADVPEPIRLDFSEALRCRFVHAFNATVKMCHRALETSCIREGASEDLVLQKMIDWVAKEGKITEPLRLMAHKVRLGGDRGAHPSSRVITAEDADAVIEFTREYLDHVYVMPAKMAKFNFDKPKPAKKGEAESGE